MDNSLIENRIVAVPDSVKAVKPGDVADLRKTKLPPSLLAQPERSLTFKLAFFEEGLDVRDAGAPSKPAPDADARPELPHLASEISARTPSTPPAKSPDLPPETSTRRPSTQPTELPRTSPPPSAERNPDPPQRIRKSRIVGFGALALVAAGLAFAYFYLQQNLGPNPIERILDTAFRGANLNAPGETNRTEAVGSITYPTRPERPQQPAVSAKPKPAATQPIAPAKDSEKQAARAKAPVSAPGAATTTSGPTPGAVQPRVTHTSPGAASPIASPAPADRQAATARSSEDPPPFVGARAVVPQAQPRSDACTDALVALGLCKPQAEPKGK